MIYINANISSRGLIALANLGGGLCNALLQIDGEEIGVLLITDDEEDTILKITIIGFGAILLQETIYDLQLQLPPELKSALDLHC